MVGAGVSWDGLNGAIRSPGLHRAMPSENAAQGRGLLWFRQFAVGTLPHPRSMKRAHAPAKLEEFPRTAGKALAFIRLACHIVTHTSTGSKTLVPSST